MKELETLRKEGSKRAWSDLTLSAGDPNPLKDLSGDLFDILATVEIPSGQASPLEFNLRGIPLTYDPAARELRINNIKAPLAPEDDVIKLRLLLDRGSVEIFGNDGRVAISAAIAPDLANTSLGVRSTGTGTPAKLKSLEVYEMNSAWEQPTP